MDHLKVTSWNDFVASDGLAHEIVTYLKGMGKNVSEFLPDRFQEHQRATGKSPSANGDVVFTLRKFGYMGFGTFIVGRRGKKSRHKLDDLCWELIRAFSDAPGAVNAPRNGMRKLETDSPDSMSRHNGLTLTFPLSETENYTFTLPRNLTLVEATRLADFIRSLGLQT